MKRMTINLPAGQVSYLEWAAGSPTRTIVLLHGGGYDSAELSWGEHGPVFARAGYRVLAPDHPGYGHSPLASWDASVANLSRYVNEFLDAMGVSDDYVLAGLSLGGALALVRGLEHPEGLRALVLFAPYGIMSRMGTGRLAPLLQWFSWASVRSGLLDALTPWYVRHRWLMESSMGNLLNNPAAKTPVLMDAIMAEAARPDAGAAFAQWQRSEITRTGLLTDLTDRLPELMVPTLIVQGSDDPGVPWQRAEQAARLIPDGRLLVIAGAAHWVQRDRPEIVHPAVLEFLEGLYR